MLGIVYWEPASISTQSFGSSWENLALFDFNGEVLNSIKVFNNNTVKVNKEDRFVFELNQNYPNPFNPYTNIKYSLPVSKFVILKVYDILGNEMSILVNETKEPGSYEIKFDASDLPSGVYFYSINVDGFFQVRKMILAK
ncbi:MAG: T9SS type A sorting domain-containing protein [Melioribacteraceae bacterium]|nr:T9SS type A sorting domain-containing protein [Melioribacteraceae bacterium]